MSNHLTDRQFWVNYWEKKRDLIVKIPGDYLFHQQLTKIAHQYKTRTAIELGGFPGYYAVFLKKYLNLEVSLLDYFIHPPLTNQLLAANGLNLDDIDIIEADLFNYQSEKKYDLVLSCGLIEHFEDTADIVNRHIDLLNPGGVLFITLPNFLSVNGWFQRQFDRENYDKHNMRSMDPQLLRKICQDAGLLVTESGYFGKFSIWLENENVQSLPIKLFKKITWLGGKLLTKFIPAQIPVMAPYIVVQARKPSA